MDCDSIGDTAQQQRPRAAWVKVQADDYTAVVSTANIFTAHPGSLLASLVELELSTQQQDLCVRLDCSAEVAKVGLLMLGMCAVTSCCHLTWPIACQHSKVSCHPLRSNSSNALPPAIMLAFSTDSINCAQQQEHDKPQQNVCPAGGGVCAAPRAAL